MRKVKYNGNNQFQIEKFKFQRGWNEIPQEKLDKMLMYSAFQNRMNAGIIEIPAFITVKKNENEDVNIIPIEVCPEKKDKIKPLKSRKNKSKNKE